MAISVTNISADQEVENIECHFKVSAGPGAGKTRWLINHIRNILNNSKRLGNSRKVACITYTNVAAEIILERIGYHTNRVEVSTFHSYLYKHVLKPFSFLIPTEYELDITKIDGHDEIPIYKGWLFEWKTTTRQTYLKDDSKIVEAFRDLAWQLNDDGKLILRTRKVYSGRIGVYAIRNDSYIDYKKIYWRKGLLDHEDVLFFSYILISQNPKILTVLRAKFPYFFLDEFQDTNPIQTAIVKKIAENETIIGIIGDVAQSIYGFQGAEPDQFLKFSMLTLQQYAILDNYRSTNQIISLLNVVRTDLIQQGKRNVNGDPISFLVGNKIWALLKAEELAEGQIYSLTRDNITSNIMRDRSTLTIIKKNLIEVIRDTDSNSQRMNTIIGFVKATEIARQNRYKDALKEISKEIKKIIYPKDVNKVSLQILKQLLSKYNEYKNVRLIEYKALIDLILPIKLASFKNGKIKELYSNTSYEQVAACVNINDDNSYHRTIHKAKGAEFDNVLLVLDNKNRAGNFDESEAIDFLISPDLNNNEEHRIKYVALSRAREKLFINVPSLSQSSRNELTKKGCAFIDE